MFQQIAVIYFDTMEKANRFVNSTEGSLFDDPYGDGQDNFEYTTYAGDPKLPFLITTILKNHFGFKENSHLVAHTYCAPTARSITSGKNQTAAHHTKSNLNHLNADGTDPTTNRRGLPGHDHQCQTI